MNWKFLEPITTFVLVAVIGSLGWIIAASIARETVHWVSTEAEIIAILILLTTAIVLVSVLALGNSQSRRLP
jgi:hypothetical protein